MSTVSLSSSSRRLGDVRRTHAEPISGDLASPACSFGSHAADDTAAKSGSVAVDLLAALILTIIQVVNCMCVASILRGEWRQDFIDPFFRHCTYGFVLAQVATTAISGFPGALSPSAFENLPVFQTIRENIVADMAAEGDEAQVVTFLACIVVSTLISSALLAMLAVPKLTKILTYLPDYVRHGVFMAIGVSIFMLGFDSFDLDPYKMATWTTSQNVLKWCPAYILGLLLWFLDEYRPSRFLLVGFIAAVTAGVHLTFYWLEMDSKAAADGGWVLGEGNVAGSGPGEFFKLTYGSLGKVKWVLIVDNLASIFVASVVGPILNVSINVLVLEGLFGIDVYYPREFVSQAVGSLMAALGFGFNSYFATADTSLMQKAGGRGPRPVLFMCGMLLAVCLVPPVLPFLTRMIPNLLAGSLFVYIGIAIVLGCLSDMRTTLAPSDYAFSLLTCSLCVLTSLPLGMFAACAVCLFRQKLAPSLAGEAPLAAAGANAEQAPSFDSFCEARKKKPTPSYGSTSHSAAIEVAQCP